MKWILVAGLLATLAVIPAWGNISINLYCSGSGSNISCPQKRYDDENVFTSRYANIPGNKMSGHIMEPFPNNACLYITPLPDSLKVNGTKWFALVSDYPACPEQMIDNVQNAGFDLIIAYGHNRSSPHGLRSAVENKNFPIVSISGKYAHYLSNNALSVSPDDPITARVEVSNYDLVIVVLSGVGILLIVVTVCLLLLVLVKWKLRLNVRGRYIVNRQGGAHLETGRTRRYAQARIARQELIESILRQLQEMQGEGRQHIPLGEADTQALPLQPAAQVKRESHGKEACAICVEDFQDVDTVRVLPCNHYFHPECIDPWLTDHSSLCPLCKQRIPRKGEEEEEEGGGGRRGGRERGFRQFPVLLETSSDEESSTPSAEYGSAQSIQSVDALPVVATAAAAQVAQEEAVSARESVSLSSSSLSSSTPLMEAHTDTT